MSTFDGQGVLELLNYINNCVPRYMRDEFTKRREKRVEKF